MASEASNTPQKILQTECPICLEALCYPAKLPCEHVFCYLCIKGFLNTQNSRCALCRTEVPSNYLLNPNLILDEKNFENATTDNFKSNRPDTKSDSPEDLTKNQEETTFVWYYEGRNGWWQYDERTNVELENEFRKNPKTKFELQIAGLLYLIDFDKRIQSRTDDSNKKRRIKRDLKYVKHTKGVAGIKGWIQSKN